MRTKPWDRRLWGVLFTSATSEQLLIGRSWFDKELHGKEPTRPMLFQNRKLAREACATLMAEWSDNESLKSWRVRPVRVRERVEVV